MGSVDVEELFFERKSDPFYEKRRLKTIQQKPLYGLKKGKVAEYIVMRSDNRHHGRKCREIPSNEYLTPNVPYSMNSKYRFETMQPTELAKKSGAGEGHCIIHEQVIRDSQAINAFKSKYYADDVKASSGCVGGLVLGNANTLKPRSATKKPLRRKCKKGRGSDNESNDQSDVGKLTVYTISQTLMPNFKAKKSHGKKTKARQGNQRVDIDWEVEEECTSSEFDEDSDSGVYSSDVNSVIADFSKDVSLTEFVTTPTQSENKAVEDGKDAVLQPSLGSPSKPASSAVIFPKGLAVGSRYELSYKAEHWGNYDFVADAEKLLQELPAHVKYTWLTPSHKAFSINIYSGKTDPLENLPNFKAVFELGTFHRINICVSGLFKLRDARKILCKNLYSSRLKSLNEIVQAVFAAYDCWTDPLGSYCDELHDGTNNAFNACEVPGNKRLDNRVNDVNFEYWQACDPISETMETYDDNDLLVRLRGECNLFEQDEKLGYEQILAGEQSPCEICSCRSVSGRSHLYCFHNVCVRCLGDWLLAQLKADVFPITCPVNSCDNIVPLVIVEALLPIVYYQFYIRRSLKHLTTCPDSDVICCPGCLNVGVFSKNLRYNSLKCSKCKATFCRLCGSSPHWPLDCNEAERWIPLFVDTGKVVKLRLESKLQKKMIVRRCCFCDAEVVAGDLVETASCPCTQWYSFDMKTGLIIIPKNCFCTIYVKGELREASEVCAEFVREYCPKYSVESKYCRHWYEARERRKLGFTLAPAHSKIIKERSGVSYPFSMNCLRERQILAYHLIEYGWIWLYIHRNDDLPQWKDVYSGLERMEKLLEKLLDELKLETLPNIVVNTLDEIMNNIEKTVANVMSSLKS